MPAAAFAAVVRARVHSRPDCTPISGFPNPLILLIALILLDISILENGLRSALALRGRLVWNRSPFESDAAAQR